METYEFIFLCIKNVHILNYYDKSNTCMSFKKFKQISRKIKDKKAAQLLPTT